MGRTRSSKAAGGYTQRAGDRSGGSRERFGGFGTDGTASACAWARTRTHPVTPASSRSTVNGLDTVQCVPGALDPPLATPADASLSPPPVPCSNAPVPSHPLLASRRSGPLLASSP